MDLKENFNPNILTCYRLNAAKSGLVSRQQGKLEAGTTIFPFLSQVIFIEQRPPDPSRAWRLSDKHY